ncbi:MAG: GNAT family N-acetyltransferase [Terriglobales bacterium]
MSPDALIRQATPDDIPALLRHRQGMYADMGFNNPAALSAMLSTCKPYLSTALANGALHGWLACVGEQIVAGGVVLISPWPSHPYDGQCRRATILNLYTDPPFRRQGIARRLMQTMIDWCRAEGFVHVTLHASDKGRPLYESLGFESTNEMRLNLGGTM